MSMNNILGMTIDINSVYFIFIYSEKAAWLVQPVSDMYIN